MHIIHVHVFVTKVKPSTIANAGDGLFLASVVAPQGTALIEEQAVRCKDACRHVLFCCVWLTRVHFFKMYLSSISIELLALSNNGRCSLLQSTHLSAPWMTRWMEYWSCFSHNQPHWPDPKVPLKRSEAKSILADPVWAQANPIIQLNGDKWVLMLRS